MIRYRVEIDGEVLDVEIAVIGDRAHAVVSSAGVRRRVLVVPRAGGALECSLDAGGSKPLRAIPLTTAGPAEVRFFTRRSDVLALVSSTRDLLRSATRRAASRSRHHVVVSEIPGVVRSVRVERGDDIEHGAPLLTLEAMKMENEIVAPVSGAVCAVHVRPGSVVAAGDSLIEIETRE